MRSLHRIYILGALVLSGVGLAQIKVTPAITHVSCAGSTNGSVKLTATGTGTPYTYTWMPGSTTGNTITSKPFGTYSVTIQNASSATLAATYNIGYKTKWQSFYSGMTASSNGDTLKHTNDGVGSWLKGADGANKIKGSTDGWIEYVATNSDPKIFGLLDSLSISGDDGIDFGLGLNSGTVYTENNGSEVSISTYVAGDVLRIERVGATINFKKNGAVIWTTSIPTSMVKSGLTIRAALYNPNTALETLGCSAPAPNAVIGVSGPVTCSSPSVTLTASSSTSGLTYSWSPGGASTSSISVGTAGNYTLAVTDPTTGCVTTATTAVTTNTSAPGLAFSTIPTASLQAYWPFDGNANDMSGNGNNGTVTSASLTADRFGNPNKAYYFNGTTSRIDVLHSSTVDMASGSDYTISFWLKTNPGNVNGLPISKTLYGAWNGYMFMVNNTDVGYCHGTGKFTYYVAAGANGDACADNLISNDAANWYFITGQYKSSTNQTFLYVNSVLQSDIGSKSGTVSNTNNLTFGTHNAVSGGFYNGYLDDIRFYKRLLTQDEINTLYSGVISCSNPSVTVTGISPTSGVTYSWSPGGATTSSLAVSAGGTYTLKVTNPANGCVSTSTVLVSETPCNPYYFTLKKTLDGGYYDSYKSKIYFSFEEEYYDSSQGSANSLSYTIVTDKNIPVSSAPGLIEQIGDNRYSIDLSTVSGMTVGGFYRIAITNKKNEVFYARFKY